MFTIDDEDETETTDAVSPGSSCSCDPSSEPLCEY